MQESIVKDPALAPEGHRKIDWAAEHSPVLNTVRERFLKDGTFDGLGVGVALPIEAKTAYLTVVLAEAGADVALASPGPFFVQDDVAAALAERGVTVYASSENDPEDADDELERVIDRAADNKEAVFIDDRAGLVRLAHTTRRDLLGRIRGASEETTSGVAKFRLVRQGHRPLRLRPRRPRLGVRGRPGPRPRSLRRRFRRPAGHRGR
jgi:adenosylhomocysteinase